MEDDERLGEERQVMEVKLIVNGVSESLEVEPGETLLDTLRMRVGLSGVKQSCDYGGCGACTVIADGKTVYSCMTLALKLSGARITTVEGLENNGKLSPLQQLFVEKWALQCGFCTPGILMSAKCLLDTNPNPTEEVIREALSGHVCRCTGYARIIDAITEAARSQKI